MNMIRGKTTRDSKAVESGIGLLPLARKMAGVVAGEETLLGVRPSDIRFAAKGEKGVAASIAMLEPLGDVTVVSVEAGGETLRMVLPESAAASLQPGQAASIYLDPQKFHIFRASNGQALS
jgi:ABC-type sugar transport system ATPase subunit